MTVSTSQNRAYAGISSSPLNPTSFENMLINTSFPLMHIPLLTSLPHIRGNITTSQIPIPPSPPLSFSNHNSFYTLVTHFLQLSQPPHFHHTTQNITHFPLFLGIKLSLSHLLELQKLNQGFLEDGCFRMAISSRTIFCFS